MNFLKLQQFQNISWCKPNWPYPDETKGTNDLLKQCTDLQSPEVSDDVEDIIRRSNDFPIPFPIETVRLATLKDWRPIERLSNNISSTYPLLHERVLWLMARFLQYKREFGSSIEKEFYKDMTIGQFIDRILKKRAIVFMKSNDTYKLITGKEGANGWEAVGTTAQKPPLLLEHCLSYDEMKISAMVYVSGYTECINDGNRFNKGVVMEEGIQQNAVIIGIIGPRFKRKMRMDCEDILISKTQNRPENGYGNDNNGNTAKRMWRQMWNEFYEVPNNTYQQISPQIPSELQSAKTSYIDRFVKVPKSDDVFDNEVYYKRLRIIVETVLLEAEARAVTDGKNAFVNVIGAGLGVWRASHHQNDIYLLSFIERIHALLKDVLLNHVSDVNFAYIKPTSDVLAAFKESSANSKLPKNAKKEKMFLDNKNHPKGGINVYLEDRQPSEKLTGEHEGKLLVMTYAWDGNAHPGNEFWIGKLASSGDSAAAVSTQISELHNAYINPNVHARNTRVAGRGGVTTVSQFCRRHFETG